MKKMILFLMLFCAGLCSYALETKTSGGVSYDVFSPEKTLNAKLNAVPIQKENCNYFILPVSKDSAAYASDVKIPDSSYFYDPYIFKYKGFNYLFVKNNGEKLTPEDILGINDNVQNLFKSLIALDLNNDNKITQDEITMSNVRIAKISSQGKLLQNPKTDFDLNSIKYIDVSEIKTITNSLNTGINAHFYIYLKSGNEKIIGLVISSDEEIINKLF